MRHNVSAWAQYTIQVKNRNELQSTLKQANIPTAIHYSIPLNRQPAVADDTPSLPIGDAVAEKVISLPIHPYLEQDNVQAIVSAIADVSFHF